LLKGPEAGGEGTAPALQNVTEGRTPASVRLHDVPWPEAYRSSRCSPMDALEP